MAISYIKGADKTTSVTATEKVKVNYLDKLQSNPWLPHRLQPMFTEALRSGGGIYKFRTVLGGKAAVRRTAAPTKTGGVELNGVIANKEVTLTVSQPFETEAYPMENGDRVQLDGIDYSPITTERVLNELVEAEIQTETKLITEDADSLVIDLSAKTDALEQLAGIKEAIANYYDISESNAVWKGATSTVKAYEYFTGKGSLAPEQLRVHMHPADVMKFSNAITKAGAGSDGQYGEFVKGAVPIIGGIQVIQNNRVGVGAPIILPLQMVGTPDPAVMTTNVVVAQDPLQFIEAARGQHYFDGILPTPELITRITL